MKKYFLSFLTLYFLSVSPFAHGEDNGDNDNFLNVQLDVVKLLLIGAIDTSVDVKIHDNILVGLRYWAFKLDVLFYKYNYSGVGGGVTYAFSGALQDSFTIGIDYVNLNASVEETLSSNTFDTTGTILLTYVGYHWFWESFNMALLLGSGSLNTKKATVTNDDTGEKEERAVPTFPTLDLKFKLGFAF